MKQLLLLFPICRASKGTEGPFNWTPRRRGCPKYPWEGENVHQNELRGIKRVKMGQSIWARRWQEVGLALRNPLPHSPNTGKLVNHREKWGRNARTGLSVWWWNVKPGTSTGQAVGVAWEIPGAKELDPLHLCLVKAALWPWKSSGSSIRSSAISLGPSC